MYVSRRSRTNGKNKGDRIGCPKKLVVSVITSVVAYIIINGSTILRSLCHLSCGNQGDEDDVGSVERMNRLHLDKSWINCEFSCHRRNVHGWL
jgi:hypothetical protein